MKRQGLHICLVECRRENDEIKATLLAAITIVMTMRRGVSRWTPGQAPGMMAFGAWGEMCLGPELRNFDGVLGAPRSMLYECIYGHISEYDCRVGCFVSYEFLVTLIIIVVKRLYISFGRFI